MTALYMLIPVAVVIVGLVIWLLFWAVNNGQYDDLDGPAHSILFDDDEIDTSKKATPANNTSHNVISSVTRE